MARLALAAAGAYLGLGLLQPWELLQRAAPLDTTQATLAVIVPVLNEAQGILDTLRRLRGLQPPPDELIVVDGGSTDGTAELVQRSGLATRVLSSGRGRSRQMNAGADAATSDLLCFVHADTLPPLDLVSVARRELADPRTVLAGFVPLIEAPGSCPGDTPRPMWVMSAHNFLKTYYAPALFRPLAFLRGLRALFGDQSLFCRAADFRAVGGFDPELRIMEDADLCVRMHEAGPLRGGPAAPPRPPLGGPQGHAHGRATAKEWSGGGGGGGPWAAWRRPRGRVKMVLSRLSRTSGRRIAAWGSLRATWIHMVVGTSWYFGRDPVALERLYERLYTDAFR